jgi:ABC-type polysaccharide/polyol phosphate transport system ATPase subunit
MSSNDVAIRVSNLGKRYQIYNTPRDRLKQFVAPRMQRLTGQTSKQYFREFWAIKDVSFEVKKGECLGILGRNGSGKSTLLQIIAGTLAPTTGSVSVNGKIAALLELGSGFNPEFTGRENVYMNGAIMGLSRAKIDKRFDAIAAFADIGEFIEQPVKIYSSGMFLRLAFACATAIEPAILIVDEALAVGDGAFVHKCMARIKSLADKGTVLILVTHDIETVKRFCQKGIWLDSGKIKFCGHAGEAGDKYYAFLRMGNAMSAASSHLEHKKNVISSCVEMPLVQVGGEIDLSDDRLFLESPWVWTETNGVYGRGRIGRNSQKAFFRFFGTELELCFLRGGDWSDPKIIIDGKDRPYTGFGEWHATNYEHLSVLRFSVIPGEHMVEVQLADGNRPLLWLSGRTKNDSTEAEFRSDPRFIHGDPGGCGRYGNGRGRIVAAELLEEETNAPISSVKFGHRFKIRVWAECLAIPTPPRIGIGVHIKDKNQIWIFGSTNWDARVQVDTNAKRWQITFGFENRLESGDYGVLLALAETGEDLELAVHMDVIETALVFRSIRTTDHPAAHGLVYQPAVVDVVSLGQKDSACP